MTYRRALLPHVILVWIGVSISALAQSADQRPDVNARERQEIRLLNIARVKKFAERALDFRDLRTKAATVSRLADLLWDDDEPYARQLFSKALDACFVAGEGSSASEEKTSKRGSQEKTSKRDVASIRRLIIGYISRRDVKWAQRLIDSDLFSEAAGYSGSQANIETAYDLALNSKTKSAADFAERSLNGGVSPWIVGLLVELRRTDQKLSDSLFLSVLDKFASQPSELNTFLYLGTYLFTSPKVNPDDPTAVSQVVVGNVLVYDLTLDRPNVAPSLVRSYLQTAAVLLARSNSLPQSQLSLPYVAGYLLLPKAQRFAPDLAPGISAAMQALAPKIPQDLLDTAAHKNLVSNSPLSTAEVLSEIEKLLGEGPRDEKYLSLVASLWQKKQYETARSVAKRLSDSNVAQRLVLVIDFGEAADSLSKNDVLPAQRIAEKMPRSIERALLWLAIANARFVAKDTTESAAAVTSAAESARALSDVRRGNILLESAGLMARLNTGNAITVLGEAIKEFNAQNPGAFRRIEWRQTIEAGRITRTFSLKVKGVDNDYTRAAASLVSLDAVSLITELDSLTQEEPRSQLMVAVAEALLT